MFIYLRLAFLHESQERCIDEGRDAIDPDLHPLYC